MVEYLTSVPKETLDLASHGLIAAMFIRWVLSLRIGLVSAAAIGVTSLCLSPSISEGLASMGKVPPAHPVTVGVAISLVAMLVAQLVRGDD